MGRDRFFSMPNVFYAILRDNRLEPSALTIPGDDFRSTTTHAGAINDEHLRS